MTHGSFNVPEYRDRPQPFEQIWHLRKGRKTTACSFWTHALGAEIRVEIGAELLGSEAGRDPSALFGLAMTWKQQFEEKGWKMMIVLAAADWTNVGMLLTTIVLVGVTALYVAATFWLYRSQTDPDVVVFATEDEVEQTLIWIVVQNIGKTVASDIAFHWDSPPMKQAYGLTEEEANGAPAAVPFTGPLE
jgi:hypothetical protein